MEFYTQWRLRGDTYNNGFGNGLTISDGESTQSMRKIAETEDETIFRGRHGHTIKCLHQKQGDVTICRTIFENTT